MKNAIHILLIGFLALPTQVFANTGVPAAYAKLVKGLSHPSPAGDSAYSAFFEEAKASPIEPGDRRIMIQVMKRWLADYPAMAAGRQDLLRDLEAAAENEGPSDLETSAPPTSEAPLLPPEKSFLGDLKSPSKNKDWQKPALLTSAILLTVLAALTLKDKNLVIRR